tara:strand:- start:474 stop:1706 length:1233 start_codon:yes stop_codon:yes gene_type:complete
MSKISLTPNAAGTGTFSIASPNSNTNRTLTLPDSAGELLTTTGDGSGLTGIVIPPIFNPVAVTGATPSLDVGAYNFFSQGALTANTTVSFASVPTNARWSYSFKPAVFTGSWDISTASYARRESVSSQDTTPLGVFFKPDGTKMYVLGYTASSVHEYDLSTAWAVNTADFLQSFNVSAQAGAPTDVSFKPDGTKMYVLGSAGDVVVEYNLSSAWNVSTASYLQSKSVVAQEIDPSSLSFKPDGTKMYVLGNNGDDVNEYNLSTAWDVSTATFLQLFSVAGQEITPRGLSFKPDGTKMYVLGNTGDDVNEYDLSTAWDVTTATFLQLFSVAAQDTFPRSLFFKPDGTKMYVLGGTGVDVNEYILGTDATLTLPASIENPPTQALARYTQVTYDFYTMDGGTTVNLIGEEVV